MCSLEAAGLKFSLPTETGGHGHLVYIYILSDISLQTSSLISQTVHVVKDISQPFFLLRFSDKTTFHYSHIDKPAVSKKNKGVSSLDIPLQSDTVFPTTDPSVSRGVCKFGSSPLVHDALIFPFYSEVPRATSSFPQRQRGKQLSTRIAFRLPAPARSTLSAP